MIQSVLNALVFQKMSLIGKMNENSNAYQSTKFLEVDARKRKLAYRVAIPEKTDGTVIIYFHGNAMTIYDLDETMQLMANVLQSTVVYYDYPGYGLSPGTCTENRVKSDALEVYQFVKQAYTWSNNDNKIVLFGRSLGSGPATYVASIHTDVRALILLSPFTSIIHTQLDTHFFDQYDMFRNDRYMPYIKAPVLMFHGLNDQVIPPEHSEELFALSKNVYSEVYMVKHVGHSDVFTDAFWDKILPIILQFLVKR